MPPERSLRAEYVAERREVTVMFADVVGSTALSARTDANDLREIVAAYPNCVAEIVCDLGGRSGRDVGDSLTAFFADVSYEA